MKTSLESITASTEYKGHMPFTKKHYCLHLKAELAGEVGVEHSTGDT